MPHSFRVSNQHAHTNAQWAHANAYPATFIPSVQQYQRSLRTPCSLEKAQQLPHRPPYHQSSHHRRKGRSFIWLLSVGWRVEEEVEGRGRESWEVRAPAAQGHNPAFPMPTSDHRSRQGALYKPRRTEREGDHTSHGVRHSHSRGDREETGDTPKTRNNPATLTSPLCNLCTACAPRIVGYYRKAKPWAELHISISIAAPGWLLHLYIPQVSTLRCCWFNNTGWKTVTEGTESDIFVSLDCFLKIRSGLRSGLGQ